MIRSVNYNPLFMCEHTYAGELRARKCDDNLKLIELKNFLLKKVSILNIELSLLEKEINLSE